MLWTSSFMPYHLSTSETILRNLTEIELYRLLVLTSKFIIVQGKETSARDGSDFDQIRWGLGSSKIAACLQYVILLLLYSYWLLMIIGL